MGLFDRVRGRGRRRAGRVGDDGRRGTLDRGSQRVDLTHLEQFVASRRGVEGYVEPRTAVTETTIVLVAADGEWTRRRIDGPDVARRLSRDLGHPGVRRAGDRLPPAHARLERPPEDQPPRLMGTFRAESPGIGPDFPRGKSDLSRR